MNAPKPYRARSPFAALAGLLLAGTALAASPAQERSAGLQCGDRKVTVEATCVANDGPVALCTRQAIRFAAADGTALGKRVFAAKRVHGAPYPVVPEQFGELGCVEPQAGERFVVAIMDDGGNCDACEWADVYTADGTLVGSTRDRKKVPAVDKAVKTMFGQTSGRVLARQLLTDVYAQSPAPAQDARR